MRILHFGPIKYEFNKSTGIILLLSIEYNILPVLAFIDFHKALDMVKLNAAMKALQKCHVKSDYNPIRRGVRQGGTMSAKLFITVLRYAYKTLVQEERP